MNTALDKQKGWVDMNEQHSGKTPVTAKLAAFAGLLIWAWTINSGGISARCDSGAGSMPSRQPVLAQFGLSPSTLKAGGSLLIEGCKSLWRLGCGTAPEVIKRSEPEARGAFYWLARWWNTPTSTPMDERMPSPPPILLPKTPVPETKPIPVPRPQRWELPLPEPTPVPSPKQGPFPWFRSILD